MRKSQTNRDKWVLVRELLKLASREAKYLKITADRLKALSPSLEWVKRLESNIEGGELLDAFVSRFGRLQDTLGDKLLPSLLRVNLEPIGTQLDNLSRAEKLGWIDSQEQWIEMRTLRNRLVHEYVDSPVVLHQALLNVLEVVPVLLDTQKRFAENAKGRHPAT